MGFTMPLARKYSLYEAIILGYSLGIFPGRSSSVTTYPMEGILCLISPAEMLNSLFWNINITHVCSVGCLLLMREQQFMHRYPTPKKGIRQPKCLLNILPQSLGSKDLYVCLFWPISFPGVC